MTSNNLVEYTIPLAGALSAGAGVLRYPVPFAAEIVQVDVAINTAPTGADVLLDINKNGTTIFTDQTKRPKIVAGTNAAASVKVTRGVAVNPGPGTNQPNDTGVGYVNVNGGVVPSDTPVATLAAGDYITVDVDQIGSTVAGSNAVVSLLLKRK
jgi:uncharacterized protein YuzE